MTYKKTITTFAKPVNWEWISHYLDKYDLLNQKARLETNTTDIFKWNLSFLSVNE